MDAAVFGGLSVVVVLAVVDAPAPPVTLDALPFNFSYTLYILDRDCPPMASFMAASFEGSTWKVSAMQFCAISIDSASSAANVPSLRLEPRKSMIASARRFFDSDGGCFIIPV